MNTQQRSVSRVVTALTVIDDGDMRLLRALPSPARTSLGPFVFIDHYRHESLRGIGDKPHPHAGIEVVSYLLEGGVAHRDSLGFRDRLGPGDAQHIRAGRGMLHAEQPLSGRHGLQLWVSLPPDLKGVAPTYRSFRAAQLPVVRGNGSTLRVIAGEVGQVRGPMELSGGAVFAHAQLDAESMVSLPIEPDIELGVYVLQGSVTIGDQLLDTGQLAVLRPGQALDVSGVGFERSDFVLIGGRQHRGEVLLSGPFVMDTAERLDQARRDYSTGRMGRLEGIPF